MSFDQSPFDVRFDWGERGLEALGSGSDTIVIVDVLSFSTAVDVAVSRGASVLPYRWGDDSAGEYAARKGAILASKRGSGGYSLSPASLVKIPSGERIVLPSPNGATLSLRAASLGVTIAGCLRNAPAVGEYLRRRGGTVSVIACGERWADGSLRPAWEDLVGAGAIIAGLSGSLSPEAQVALASFRAAERDLARLMASCVSGRELVERGFPQDVEVAAAYGASDSVPQLAGDAFVDFSRA